MSARLPWLVARARTRAETKSIPPAPPLGRHCECCSAMATPQRASAQSFSFDGKLYRGSFERTDDGQIVNRHRPRGVSLQRRSARNAVGVAGSGTRDPGDLCTHLRFAAQRPAPLVRSRSLRTRSALRRHDAERRPPAVRPSMQPPEACLRSPEHSRKSRTLRAAAAIPNRPQRRGEVRRPPYLSGVVCNACSDSPNYRWQRSLAFDAIALAAFRLLSHARQPQRRAHRRTRRQRTSALARAADRSRERRCHWKRVSPGRRIARVASLLLTDVRRAPDGAGILFTGGGLGHGVGLCQWGARGMALTGTAAVRDSRLLLSGYGHSAISREHR